MNQYIHIHHLLFSLFQWMHKWWQKMQIWWIWYVDKVGFIWIGCIWGTALCFGYQGISLSFDLQNVSVFMRDRNTTIKMWATILQMAQEGVLLQSVVPMELFKELSMNVQSQHHPQQEQHFPSALRHLPLLPQVHPLQPIRAYSLQ